MLHLQLASPSDFAGFRRLARLCLQRRIPPHDIVWSAGPGGDLFGKGLPDERPADDGPVPHVSRDFLDTAQAAALHRADDRFDLIYRLLWRMVDEPRLFSLSVDPDVMHLGRYAKAVRRDIHKMHAFVRFRLVEAGERETYLAWYEPDHHVVEAASPFFAKRFANMRWAILTPDRCAFFADGELGFTAGASADQAKGRDALEELWRSYYANIFNPARVNPQAMRAEMPKRFWRNLPEAALIGDLVADAPRRAAAMVAAQPTMPIERRGAVWSAPERPAEEDVGLPAVQTAVAACRACSLHEMATQAVCGEGPPDARLMLVGEQPGDREDIEGRPFVGPAGELLDRALAAAGIAREAVYVTNAVKHFKFTPRGKKRIHKRPSSGEISACRGLLERELAIVRPRILVLLGASAARAVLGRATAVLEARGEPFDLGHGRTGLVTTHPAYILRLSAEEDRARAFAGFVADLARASSLADEAAAA